MKVKSESEVAQSCPTLRDPMNCSLPGSSVHGIFQARVLERVAIAFSNPDSILKSRDFTLPTKVHLVKAIGEDNGTPFQYSCLENPINGGAWWATVHGVSKSRTQLSDFTLTFHFHALEEEMATHSSVLALRIPGTGEPGGLLSMGLHRVRHD